MTSVNDKDAIDLESLVKGKYGSLSITFNEDHAPVYMTATEMNEADGWYQKDDSWVSEEERQKALKNNTVWSLQWYPDTPIGFYVIRASSLHALLCGLQEHINAEVSHDEVS